MIVDIHCHYTNAPAELQAYRGRQVTAIARPTKGSLTISDDAIRETMERGQIAQMRERGTDRALFSPHAAGMGHHFGSELVSRYWTETNNELIHRVCQLYRGKLWGVCQLPQSPGVSPRNCVDELERCVTEFGFVGCNINPDPSGGAGWSPSLGDEWWYPLYEKLVELDVPAMIHASATVNPAFLGAASYFINWDTAAATQLLESKVFSDFPTLKVVIPHGGGAIPYQLARYRGMWASRKGWTPFEDVLKHLHFDTAVYSRDAMEVLIRAIGPDNVLFASEMFGAVNVRDPNTGRWFDDNRGYIEEIPWLSAADRSKIFEKNALRLYARLGRDA